MSQDSSSPPEDEMQAEYDFRGGVRGKYYERYRQGTEVVILESDGTQQGTKVVILEPDVAQVFRDAESVNQALRMLIDIARKQVV